MHQNHAHCTHVFRNPWPSGRPPPPGGDDRAVGISPKPTGELVSKLFVRRAYVERVSKLFTARSTRARPRFIFRGARTSR
eukprot:1195363-Prorocentrum_minimum.AAC.1